MQAGTKPRLHLRRWETALGIRALSCPCALGTQGAAHRVTDLTLLELSPHKVLQQPFILTVGEIPQQPEKHFLGD